MDIKGGEPYPSGALSNFAPYEFIFDGVPCASMEGLLQSFKFDDPAVQVEVCTLKGFEAKRRGTERNDVWQGIQILWWQGKAYVRRSPQYQDLLDKAFHALATNPEFCEALLATGDEELTHSIGNPKESQTVLTEKEFCSRLMAIRLQLQKATV